MNARPLRTAVVGLGIGMAHVAGYLAAERADLVAVADRWEPRRRTLGGTFEQGSMHVLRPLFRSYEEGGLDRPWDALGVTAHSDIAEVATDRSIHLVSVCTPDDLHEEHALRLLESGKHLLLEKPPALTLEGVARIRDAAKRSKRRVAIGYEFRINPAVARLRELVADGTLGDLRALSIYHIRTPFRRDKWEGWIQRRSRSGGLIVEETCHWFDLARFIPGKEIAELVCHATADIHPDFDFEDVAFVQGRYEDGAVFQISHALTAHDFSLVFCVHGTRGSAWCGLKEQRYTSFDAGATDHFALLSYAPLNAQWSEAKIERWGEEASEPYNIRDSVRTTVDAILDGTELLADLEDGERSLAIALAARTSYEEGKPVFL